jgi:hypothetical protein
MRTLFSCSAITITLLAAAGCSNLHYQSEIILVGPSTAEQVEQALSKIATEGGLDGVEKPRIYKGIHGTRRIYSKNIWQRPGKYGGLCQSIVLYHERRQKAIIISGKPSRLHQGIRSALVEELLKLEGMRVFVIDYYIWEMWLHG